MDSKEKKGVIYYQSIPAEIIRLGLTQQQAANLMDVPFRDSRIALRQTNHSSI